MQVYAIFFGLAVTLGSFLPAFGNCRRGETGELVSLEQLVSTIKPGTTLFLGELHGFQAVADGQLAILRELRSQGHSIDVGFEFFSYPHQNEVDRFRRGELSESDFLGLIGWGKGTDFGFYRAQALFPDYKRGERTLAINAPRSLTGAVSKRGLEGLNEAERSLLPPNLTLGRIEYFERFRTLMGGHVKEEALQRYFQAQSVWDDTMAWTLNLHTTSHTKVVIVGEFHVQYGGGLPYQMSLRESGIPLKVVSFVDIGGLSGDEIQEAVLPHKGWGSRADFVCLVNLSEASQGSKLIQE